MRILISADAELPVPPRLYGGIERVVDLLIQRYESEGHPVALVAHRDSTAKASAFFGWEGATSTKPLDQLKNARLLQRAVRLFEPDVVHSFSRLSWLLPLAFDHRVKIMSYQREPTGWTVRWSDRLHRGRLHFSGCSDYICRRGKQGGGKWTTIPNAVDPARYCYRPHVSHDAPLVFLSRIEPIKGCHTAIEIAKRTGRRLLIAGNHGEEGELLEYWNTRIAPEIGRNGIEYLGPVDDDQKNELLGQAAAMVVPITWNEPFGIVFIEALACGTPVISCPRGALPEIIRDGVDGFLVEGIVSACDAVNKLATLNRASCRERVETQFSGTTVSRRYLSLYSQLAAPQSGIVTR